MGHGLSLGGHGLLGLLRTSKSVLRSLMDIENLDK